MMSRIIRVTELEQRDGQRMCQVSEFDRDVRRRVPDVLLATVVITVPLDAPAAYVASQARKALRELGNDPSD